MFANLLSVLSLAVAHSFTSAQGVTPADNQNPSSKSTADCQVVINEFMSAKQTAFADEDGDYGDWIELYNCTDKEINLEGWHLSDRPHRPKMWGFPATSIPAKGYLTVWASGKGKSDTTADNAQMLHTNFSIDADGEPLLLTNAEGDIADLVEPIALKDDEVAGRFPDGAGPFFILEAPTPSQANANAQRAISLPAPTFSKPAGVYTQSFELGLSHEDPEATIYYTLDGSEPDPNNLNGQTFTYKNNYMPPHEIETENKVTGDFLTGQYITQHYEHPITIADRSSEEDRIARFSTTIEQNPDYFPEPEFSDHWMNDLIHTSNDGLAQLNRAVGNLNNLFNRIVRNIKQWRSGEKHPVGKIQFILNFPQIPYWEYTGQNLYKGTVVRAIAVKKDNDGWVSSPIATNTYFIDTENRLDLPIVSIAAAEKDLFSYEDGILVAGSDYEEWLQSGEATPDIGTPSFPANWKSKNRATGQFQLLDADQEASDSFDTEIRSHGNAARAFKTKSMRLYPQEPVDFPIFDSAEPTQFARINLRIDRDTRLHDDISHNILHGLAFATQRSEPYLVFLNGEYYAVLAAKDRRDSTFLRYQYDLPGGDFDLLAFDYANEVDVQGPVREAKEGDFSEWDNLIDRLRQEPNISIEDLEQLIDLQSFIDYHLAEIYLVNSDWPTNNNSFWRYVGNTVNENRLTDGKWRWLLYDLDRAFRRPETNMLEQTFQLDEDKDPVKASELYKRLISHPEVRQRFITRFADLINTTFTPERMDLFINRTRQALEAEMPQHIARWGAPISMGYWENHLDNMSDFAHKRPDLQRQHLQEFFDLGDVYELNINVLLENDTGELLPIDKAAIIELNTLQLGVSDDELRVPAAASSRPTEMEQYVGFPWQGKYFAEVPIELKVIPRAGYKFSHWEGDGIKQETALTPQLKIAPRSDTAINAVMVKDDDQT